MEILLVGMGGALGSIARYCLGKIITQRAKTTFPIGTFLINITGAFLLGLLNSYVHHKNPTLFLGDGFLGAYTTFSTFTYEGFLLFAKNERRKAGVYIFGSLIIGIIGFIFGFTIGNML